MIAFCYVVLLLLVNYLHGFIFRMHHLSIFLLVIGLVVILFSSLFALDPQSIRHGDLTILL